MAWVKWPIILNSFDKGGLNIGSLKAFNLALLQKWRWRLLSSPNALWVQVIKAYHGQEGGFDTNGCSFKGIWANIVGTSNFLHSKGIILSNTFRFKAGCGTRIRFWKDIWVGETPLFTRYNRLYHLDQDKDCLIIDRINNGQWSWNWSRTNLGVRNLAYLCDMLNEIGQLNIDVNEDTCTWSLGPNGTFTVKDARYRIDQNILPTLAHATTWDKSIPRKVNVFMWRLSLDRLPHRLNLSSRGMDIPAISCPSCNANVESANHVFFECDIATDMWKLVFRWCDIPLFQASSWDSFNDWIISWHASKEKKHRFYVITTSVLWWLWRYRNSVTFSSQPLRKSDLFDNVRFSSFSWLHNRDHMKLSWNDWLMDKEVNMTARDYDDALVCCVKNTIDDRIMDSGASFHATYCKEELERFKLRSIRLEGCWVNNSRALKMRLILLLGALMRKSTCWIEDQQWKVPSDGIYAAIDGRGNAALWHQRLGHMSENGMKILASKGRILDLQKPAVGFCEPCVLGKQKKVSFVLSRQYKNNYRARAVFTDYLWPTSISIIWIPPTMLPLSFAAA
ncbi:RNA-directed DNA polymerase, eukaryota, reverse transcriptase zinc-binding domain protein [Tanacetum coccineum]